MLLTGAAYYLGAVIGFALTFAPQPISILWPPNAILMGVLLLAPAAWWPLMLLAVFPAHLAAQMQSDVPFAMMLGWYFSNCSEALIGAAAACLFLKRPLRFDSFRHVFIFLLACVFLAPSLSSFIDIGLVRLLHGGEGGYWQLWRSRCFANMMAVLAFVPVLMTWRTHGAHKATFLRTGEGAIWAVAFLVLCLAVFMSGYQGIRFASLLHYAPVPLLLWAAVRFNPLVVSVSFLALTFVAIWSTTHGHGPFFGGSPADTALTVQLFFIGLGVPLFILTAAIQERRKALKAMRSDEARFSQIFRLSPDAMLISSDIEGRILDVNKRWEELFGFTREEVVGRAVLDLKLYPHDNDRRAVLERGRNGTLRDVELEMRDTRGAIHDVRLSGEGIAIGGETCFITIMRDISALKRAELHAQEQHAQLTHLTRVAVLGKLSGALAHELNQPLTAILSNAQAACRVMDKEPVDLAEIREILKDIGDEDKRAGEVIRRLRALFMKGAPELQVLDLNEIVGEAIDLARSDLITRKVSVTTALKPELGRVLGDRIQLQQVLLNLIINACDAMSGNPSDYRSIGFTTEDGVGGVRLEISDCGCGISPEASGHLFDAFFTTKDYGLGFGLSISRSIVVEHGGSIEGTNNAGGGATFRIVLPICTESGGTG
jgi:two-component system, LuxR family, sensor kinase FixL